MKVIKRKITVLVLVMAVAVILFLASGRMENGDFVHGFAVGFFAVSFLKIIQYIRISRNEKMVKKFEMEQKEERLIMLAEKSGRFTLLLTIMAEIIIGFVFMCLGNDSYATLACGAAAVQTIVYVIVYYALAKKF